MITGRLSSWQPAFFVPGRWAKVKKGQIAATLLPYVAENEYLYRQTKTRGRGHAPRASKHLSIMKRIIVGCLALMCAATMAVRAAAGEGRQAPGQKVKKWTSLAPKLKDAFFSTGEALRIGDNVLLYQYETGGWPKNVNMQLPLDEAAKAKLRENRAGTNESTIDNKATTTEITYLCRLYNATGQERFAAGALRGMDYLFRAQYANGGWPQFYPRPKGYYTHITFNDDAMTNVLKVMRDVAKGKAPYAFMPDSIRAKAQAALDKGVDCILKTQVVQDGKPTVWCAQYDEHTLKPAAARAYELVSLSGAESEDIVLFLMSLSKPSPEVVRCVEAAVEWFRKSEIRGLTFEYFKDADGKRDYRMVPCPDGKDCPPLWARFYTIDGNRPFFSDRDGVARYDISEIGRERRTGYSWYNSDALEVYERFGEWEKKYGSAKGKQ